MNAAALRDLEKIEAYHYNRMQNYRDAGLTILADVQQRMAETVRVCIVTIQAAENREPEPCPCAYSVASQPTATP